MKLSTMLMFAGGLTLAGGAVSSDHFIKEYNSTLNAHSKNNLAVKIYNEINSRYTSSTTVQERSMIYNAAKKFKENHPVEFKQFNEEIKPIQNNIDYSTATLFGGVLLLCAGAIGARANQYI